MAEAACSGPCCVTRRARMTPPSDSRSYNRAAKEGGGRRAAGRRAFHPRRRALR